MPLIAKRFLTLFCTLAFTSSAFAQPNCNGSVGDPLVHIDFGSGTGFGPPLPVGTTTLLGYQALSCPTDGGYNIMSSTPACWTGDWHAVNSDATGNPNGYFMMVNAAIPPSDFYIRTVTGLCADTDYQVSFAILNIHKYGILPNITVIVETLAGMPLSTYNTGPVPLTATPTWTTYSTVANIGINTSVRIRLRNNAPGGIGNDLCLDDIMFRPIGPSIAPDIVGFPGGVANITTSNTNNLELTAVVGPCYTNNVYQWQLSTDNGASWADIPGATNPTYFRPPTGVGTYLYRLVVSPLASGGNPSCQVNSNPMTVNVTAPAGCTTVPSVTTSQSCTAGSTITVTAPLGANFTYSINGTSYQASPVFNNPAPGSYSVTYQDSNTSCTSPANPIVITAIQPVPVPTVVTPVRYCQGSAAVPLTATPVAGNTIRWYTVQTGGSPLPTAPTPSTASAGSTTYYVSQFNGTCESIRVPIVVVVSAPNSPPDSLGLLCAPWLATPGNVAFDWGNPTGFQGYNYVYTVGSGAPVYGFIYAPSHIEIPAPPGTVVQFEILSVVGLPCIDPASASCTSPCATTTTPVFTAIPSICQGTTPPTLPTTSTNGITGTWSPSAINTSVVGTVNYTFTPNQVCTDPVTISVQITAPNVTPTFAFGTSVQLCSGATTGIPQLVTTSVNGITGTWSQPTVNTFASGTYTFTPAAGQCAQPFVLNVQVNSPQTIQFTGLSAPLTICQGATPPVLNTSSNNATPVTGTWSPSTIATGTPGTATYTFTASAGQCLVSPTFTLQVTVSPLSTTTFAPIAAFCEGTPSPTLPTSSIEGITGSWSPAQISNTAIGTSTYSFTPTAGQCAASATLTVNVIGKTTPTFAAIAPFCAGTTAPILPTSSNDTPPITGVWSPAVVDNTQSGSYQFIPDANQCSNGVTLQITVNQPGSPGFQDISFCTNQPVPILASVSPAGIQGTWNPAVINAAVPTSTYEFTPDPGQCATNQTIQVTVTQGTSPTATWTTNSYFQNGSIVFDVTPPGNYLYQLDYGPQQPSNVFTNVSSGVHNFTIYDASGCADPITGIGLINLVNYPHFFTPNGDGINDYWNIHDLAPDQPQAPILIFDRYGKLLKQLVPQSIGWDGTYNGNLLPSSDYWFMVEYQENGVSKQFRSHFTLKR